MAESVRCKKCGWSVDENISVCPHCNTTSPKLKSTRAKFRKEGLVCIVVGVIWMYISFLLLYVAPEDHLHNFLRKALGALLGNLVMVPVGLILVVVYFGGVLVFFKGFFQLMIGKKFEWKERK